MPNGSEPGGAPQRPPAAAEAVRMEAIADDLRNVRGMNFIASFRDIAQLLGVGGTAPPNYRDTASAVAMWRAYDVANPRVTDYVDRQLRRIHDAGFNTVRVWLSYQLYVFDAPAMAARFRHFLERCRAHGLHVIAVLWDDDFFDPDLTSLAGANNTNYQRWVRSPGRDVVARQNGRLDDRQRRFVADMVTIGRDLAAAGEPVVLLWDAMNEPVGTDAGALAATWIAETLATVKTVDRHARTCVTPPFWDPQIAWHAQLAGNGDLDVLSFNFYGYGRRDLEGLCTNIRILCKQAGLPATKPILVAESGRIGDGMYYPEVMNLTSRVPASHTGAAGPGVGFCLFGANVGEPWAAPVIVEGVVREVNFAIWEVGDGLFYAPRFDTGNTVYVRDYFPDPTGGTTPATIASVRALALEHGHVVHAAHEFAVMPIATAAAPNPNYIPQYDLRLPDGTSRAAIAGMLGAAAAGADGSGLGQRDFLAVQREFGLVENIFFFSLAAESHYRGSARLVPADALQEMQTAYGDVRTIFATNPRWARDAVFAARYRRLFELVGHYWRLGGYASYY